MRKTWEDFEALLAKVSYPGFRYVLGMDDGSYWLQIGCDDAVDNRTGQVAAWHGRKWRLSVYMTDGEVVQTALMATLAAVEHEARERFTFMDQPIFDPHYDVYALVKLRASGAIVERAP